MSGSRTLLFAMLALAGCEDFDRLAQLKPRVVTMNVNDVAHRADGSTVLVPLPAAGRAPCELRVDAILNDGWKQVFGEWSKDGQCVFHDVPPGVTLMRLPSTSPEALWVTVKRDEVDLGSDYYGRPFVGAAVGSKLTFDINNALPLKPRTSIATWLPDFANGFNLQGLDQIMASDGQTSFPFTVNWDRWPLLEGNETVELFQSEPVDDLANETVTWTVARRGSSMLRPVSGQSVRGQVTMRDLGPGPRSLPPLSFDPRGFYAASNDDSRPYADVVAGLVERQAIVERAFQGITIQRAFTTDTNRALSMAAVNVDPLPESSWRPWLTMQMLRDSPIGDEDDPPFGIVTLGSILQGPADDLAWVDTTIVTPVQNVRERSVEGVIVTNDVMSSLTPTIVFDRPTRGTPNRYVLTVAEVSTNGNKLVFTLQPVRIIGSDTEMHVPAGALQPGRLYVFIIYASSCTASEEGAPLRSNFQQTCGVSQNRSLLMSTPDAE